MFCSLQTIQQIDSCFIFFFRTGRKKFDILFPAALVGSSAWGGKNLDELYVTTASYAFPTPQTPESGYLYVVRGLGVIGCHMYKARV